MKLKPELSLDGSVKMWLGRYPLDELWTISANNGENGDGIGNGGDWAVITVG